VAKAHLMGKSETISFDSSLNNSRISYLNCC